MILWRKRMRIRKSVFIFILVIVLAISFNSFLSSRKQDKNSEDLKTNQTEITKPKSKSKNEKREKLELTQDIAIYQSAIDTYKSAIEAYQNQTNFYKWIIWLFIAITVGFGIFIWGKYADFRKTTTKKISNFQQDAENEIKELRNKAEKETKKIEMTGNIFIGVSLVSQGKIQDAIPYLDGALKYKEFLTNEQILIIHFTLGNIYCDLGNITLAIKHASDAININENLALVRFLLARALQLSEDYNGALNEIKIAENLAIMENYTQENLAKIYIPYGNILIQQKNYDEAKKILLKAKKMIDDVMFRMPFQSHQWFNLNQTKIEAENSIDNIEIRKLLKEKYESEPSREEVTNVFAWMRLLPFANKIEYVYEIFEDSEFITKLKKVFDEVLSRPPQTWEILRYGDKILAKRQGEKEINIIIKEELEKYPEYIIKKQEGEKLDKLLKK